MYAESMNASAARKRRGKGDAPVLKRDPEGEKSSANQEGYHEKITTTH